MCVSELREGATSTKKDDVHIVGHRGGCNFLEKQLFPSKSLLTLDSSVHQPDPIAK